MKEFELIIHYDRIGDSDMYNCHEAGELIRCKDCKAQQTCAFAQYQGNDGFCSRGERKGEE